jgi:hypothetical protein
MRMRVLTHICVWPYAVPPDAGVHGGYAAYGVGGPFICSKIAQQSAHALIFRECRSQGVARKRSPGRLAGAGRNCNSSRMMRSGGSPKAWNCRAMLEVISCVPQSITA